MRTAYFSDKYSSASLFYVFLSASLRW